MEKFKENFYNPEKVISFKTKKNFNDKKRFFFFIFFLIYATLIFVYLCLFFTQAEEKKTFFEIIKYLIFGKEHVHDISYNPIDRMIWIIGASIVSGIALTISASIAQSFLQNPLADSNTLGMVDATIFGIVFLKTCFLQYVNENAYQWYYILFAFITPFFILIMLITFFNKNNSILKIILFGMMLSIFFRTLIHILKNYNSDGVNTIFALSLGGAENVYEIYPNQFQVLKIAVVFVAISFFIVLMISKKLNLCELGEEKAKSLGLNFKYLKFLGYSMFLICTSFAIVLCGNISFIGLLSLHAIRFLFKTRKYEIIIPCATVLSALILLISIMCNVFFVQFSSSIFILFFSSIILIILTQKNKNY